MPPPNSLSRRTARSVATVLLAPCLQGSPCSQRPPPRRALAGCGARAMRANRRRVRATAQACDAQAQPLLAHSWPLCAGGDAQVPRGRRGRPPGVRVHRQLADRARGHRVPARRAAGARLRGLRLHRGRHGARARPPGARAQPRTAVGRRVPGAPALHELQACVTAAADGAAGACRGPPGPRRCTAHKGSVRCSEAASGQMFQWADSPSCQPCRVHAALQTWCHLPSSRATGPTWREP